MDARSRLGGGHSRRAIHSPPAQLWRKHELAVVHTERLEQMRDRTNCQKG